MPFGLKNSGATFQRMMDNLRVNTSNVKCYVGDVVIHSATAVSHIKHLENVFALLLKHGLRIRLKKCSLIQTCVELLGHCIHKEVIHTVGRKIQTIRHAHSPRSRAELRSFLGIASYYRKFIRIFPKIARPLSEMDSEKAESQWTPQCRSHSTR